MSNHQKINYLEIPSKDLTKTKAFFSTTFGWEFKDFGPEYSAISNAGIDGGFYQSDLTISTEVGSVLVVLYSEELEETERKIIENGGAIIKATFSFPGGRRFHFTDPNGNEYAVWTDQ